MSCVFVIAAPIVIATGGFPLFAAAAVAAGASIGFRRLAAGNCKPAELSEVEVDMENSNIIGDAMAEDEKIVLCRNGVQVEFRKDERGRFGVCVRGEGIDKETLREVGEELIGRVRQQYAYQRIMEEMERRGYQVRTEESSEDRRISIRLERMA